MSTAEHQPAPDVGGLEDFASGEDHRWMAAVSQYLTGYPVPLASLLRDPASPNVSANARALLADLVEGKLPKSKGGRPAERSKRVERAIVADYFAELERQEAVPKVEGVKDGGPATTARELVAKRRGLPEDAVRGVVDRVRINDGITREKWVGWGRPDWST